MPAASPPTQGVSVTQRPTAVRGLIAGTLFATVVGYGLAKSRSLEQVLSPYLVASQAVPVVAIAPLLVIWLGNGILSKVVICALIVFFPVLVNTIVGVRAVPTALYDLMNSLHASRRQILWKVEVPASLPVFLGGLRVGATLSVIGAIVGELVSAEAPIPFPKTRFPAFEVFEKWGSVHGSRANRDGLAILRPPAVRA